MGWLRQNRLVPGPRAHPAGIDRRKVDLTLLGWPAGWLWLNRRDATLREWLPLQAIDIWHEEACLPPEYAPLDEIILALRAWNGIYLTPPQRRFKEASLILIDRPTERFYFLTSTLLKAVQQLDEHDLRRTNLLELLNRTFISVNFFEPRSPSYYRSVADALEQLTALEKLKLFMSKKAEFQQPRKDFAKYLSMLMKSDFTLYKYYLSLAQSYVEPLAAIIEQGKHENKSFDSTIGVRPALLDRWS